MNGATMNGATNALSPTGVQRQKTRIANWAAELTAKHDPVYKAVLAKVGMQIATGENDSWSATSKNAPWLR